MTWRRLLPEKLTVAQLLTQFFVLHRTRVHCDFHNLTHTLSYTFFSPPVFCSHIYFSLNIITIRALQTPC